MTKKVWRKPEVKTMSAGAAESGPANARQDGPTNGGGNFPDS
jgi:hypothetical protein